MVIYLGQKVGKSVNSLSIEGVRFLGRITGTKIKEKPKCQKEPG